ncbi:glutathionylspermidine synthase family protein [Bacillus benzoevorans]|uniref:Glutathionylspermidine synthase n=1 Tax=Bacillus benzoevorans TaxID=1456 RepID=A0A7X0HQW9_9BACI|nr:glutathionylspermidine synthase family protein [Bacillus benzoevorans]MBB6443916.1 glutathionylspermidine synthase [Bacillus benzoevorans]
MFHKGDLEQFCQSRRQVYQEVKNFWPDLFQTEYALYDMYCISQSEIKKIRETTNRAGRIFFKTAKLLRAASESTLKQLDLPKKILPFVRHQGLPVESVIARMDLVRTDDGYKVLEINSDTPTFEKEVFHVNRFITTKMKAVNPNEGLEKELGHAVRKAVFESALRLQRDEPYVVFTSHEDHIEDRGTTCYLLELAELPARYVPLHRLHIIRHEGLFDEAGRRIDILYRPTYPLEHLIEDRDSMTKDSVGIQLLELVCDGKLAVINPISAFLIQSKAVQAVIWGLMELNHPFFTEEEKSWIGKYFLPTYMEEDPFIKKGLKYVKKPCFGREGDTVEIFQGRKKIMEDAHKTYRSSAPVFQQYVDLPTSWVHTTKGIYEAKLLIGSFLLNGKASGIGIRAGNQITDNNAFFLPVGIK